MDKNQIITATSLVERLSQTTIYNVRLAEGDKAKIRTTHDGVDYADRGARVEIIGEATVVTVRMPNGDIRVFDREQIAFYATPAVLKTAEDTM